MWIDRRINRKREKLWLPKLNKKTEIIKDTISKKCFSALKEDKSVILIKLPYHILEWILIYLIYYIYTNN